MGGGGSSSSGPTPLGKEAGRLGIAGADKLFNEAQPDLKAIMQQLYDILAGGSAMTGLGIPLAQKSVGQARAAGSQAMQGADSYLAQSGLTGSPFAAAIQSMIGQQTQEQIGQAPTGVAEALLSMFGGAPMQATQTAIGTLGSIAGQSQSSSNGGAGTVLGGLGGLANGIGNLIPGLSGGGAAAGGAAGFSGLDLSTLFSEGASMFAF